MQSELSYYCYTGLGNVLLMVSEDKLVVQPILPILDYCDVVYVCLQNCLSSS